MQGSPSCPDLWGGLRDDRRPVNVVLECFGIEGKAAALAGGEGLTFRVGEVVLKRVHDSREARWTQEVLSRIECDGFRIARPIATLDGQWVHENWAASRFIDGLRPAAPSWGAVASAGLRLADAAERVRDGGRGVLSGRTHRWAVADRVAWGEVDVELNSDASAIRSRLLYLVGHPAADEYFVHGDLSGNVFFDRALVPVILDISPYLRPRRWASAIVVADAVLWNGAALSLAESFVANSTDRDLLGRALIFRLVAEQLAGEPSRDALLEPYRRVLVALD